MKYSTWQTTALGTDSQFEWGQCCHFCSLPGFNCEFRPCEGGNPCENGAVCLKEMDLAAFPLGFRCQCAKGFTGPRCEININECSSSPCRHGYCYDGAFECCSSFLAAGFDVTTKFESFQGDQQISQLACVPWRQLRILILEEGSLPNCLISWHRGLCFQRSQLQLMRNSNEIFFFSCLFRCFN